LAFSVGQNSPQRENTRICVVCQAIRGSGRPPRRVGDLGELTEFSKKPLEWTGLGLTVRWLVLAPRRAQHGPGHVGKNGRKKRKKRRGAIVIQIEPYSRLRRDMSWGSQHFGPAVVGRIIHAGGRAAAKMKRAMAYGSSEPLPATQLPRVQLCLRRRLLPFSSNGALIIMNSSMVAERDLSR
jgi:hypothetical protein